MNTVDYYAEINALVADLSEQVLAGQHPGQMTETLTLRDEGGRPFKQVRWLIMSSLYNRDRQSQAGVVCSMTIKHAARCIVDQTHKVATEEEIKKWYADQAAALEERQEAFKVSAIEGTKNVELQAKVPKHLKPYMKPEKPALAVKA